MTSEKLRDEIVVKECRQALRETRDQIDERRLVVGKFIYEDDRIKGPANYMRERGFSVITEVEAGKNIIVNIVMRQGYTDDLRRAILVALQTDYAAWHGMNDLMGQVKVSRERERRQEKWGI